MKVKKILAMFLLSVFFPNFTNVMAVKTNVCDKKGQNSVTANQKPKAKVVYYLTGKSRTVTFPEIPTYTSLKKTVDLRNALDCRLVIKIFSKRINNVEKKVIGLFRYDELDPYAICALANKVKCLPSLRDKLLEETNLVMYSDKNSTATVYVTSTNTVKLLMDCGVRLYLEKDKLFDCLPFDKVCSLLNDSKK